VSFIPDTTNEIFQLAIQLVNQSSRNIFLTGKAGTGKTTFLKYIRDNCLKQVAVVAPTGVAAINAGGVTIHSFFQLPLSPFVPESAPSGSGHSFSDSNKEVVNKHSLLSRLRLTSEKKKVLQQLELLIIDEVSMVRCDTLDAIDTILRHVRRRPMERFGGLQVLFIGDMLQLPPVIKEQEWNLLSDHYTSPYFFDSKVIAEERPVYIEFDKIYRQSEERFIQLLNQVRNNQLNAGGLELLENRYLPEFHRNSNDGYVVLTTHNEKARQINSTELKNLEGTLATYKAEIKGEFSDRSYPGDEILELKTGAQVMFIRNDTADRGKRYFNGKIGIISRLETDKIWVRCKDGSDEIEVQKEKWDNIRYSMNKITRELDQEVLGSFSQYPLRLAWAITIHKSQGLTFEKAIIDAGAAFAPGQVYVALSRCTTLEGIVLQTRIRPSTLLCDERIVEFSRRSASASQLQEELAGARKQYQLATLIDLFDLRKPINSAGEIMTHLIENRNSYNKESFTWIENILGQMDKLQDTAIKFQTQLQRLFQNGEPADNTLLQERLTAAAHFFMGTFDDLLALIQKSPAITDSRLHAKEFNENTRELFGQLALKRYLLNGNNDLFDATSIQQRRRSFTMPAFAVNAYAAGSQKKTDLLHPALYHQLRELRDAICLPADLPIYLVAGSQTLQEITRYLPQTLSELRKISGFGDAKIEKYGRQFLDIVLRYSEENNLGSLIHEKTPKRERKTVTGNKTSRQDTKAESFRLFREGKPVEQIARERKLAVSTIEAHLTHYVASGEIPVDKLISLEKLSIIEPVLEGYGEAGITPLKRKLGDNISFSEIRVAMAWASFKKQADIH